MPEFRYIPTDEVARRHRARTATAPPRQAPRPQHRNVDTVLDLGDVRYITFRSKVYAIPVVSYKAGQRVVALKSAVLANAQRVAETGQQKDMERFYRSLRQLTNTLWRHIRPTGIIKRTCWRLHLLRNPFQDASEQEVIDLTDFFLLCRMMSSVRRTSAMALKTPLIETSMSSTSS